MIDNWSQYHQDELKALLQRDLSQFRNEIFTPSKIELIADLLWERIKAFCDRRSLLELPVVKITGDSSENTIDVLIS